MEENESVRCGAVTGLSKALLCHMPPDALLRAVGVGEYYLSAKASLFERLTAALAALPYLKGHPTAEQLLVFLREQTGLDVKSHTAAAVWRALLGLPLDGKEDHRPTAVFGEILPADAVLPCATAWHGKVVDGVPSDAENASFSTRLAAFCGKTGENITSLATVEATLAVHMHDARFLRVTFPEANAFYLPHPYPAERALAAMAAGERAQPRDLTVLSLQLLRIVFAAALKSGTVPILHLKRGSADTVARFLTFLLRDGLLPPTLGIALPAKADPDEWCALAGAFAACNGQPRVRIGVWGDKKEVDRFKRAAAACLPLPLCFYLTGAELLPLEQ